MGKVPSTCLERQRPPFPLVFLKKQAKLFSLDLK